MAVKRTRIYIIFILLLLPLSLSAQPLTTVRGTITDSLTNEPIPYASIFLMGSDRGTRTDLDGNFSITVRVDFSHVRVSTLGYKTLDIPVELGSINKLDIKMVPSYITLNEVIVKPKKEKYSKKNNPAVEFARKLIDRRETGDPLQNDFFSYTKYEKITIAYDEFTEDKRSHALFKSTPYLFDYTDTSDVTGKPILNISLKERIIDYYYRKEPRTERDVIYAINRAGLDDFIDQENVQTYLNQMFQEVDLFKNDIALFEQRFVSPLSHYGVSFYKYYLLDTLDIEGERCIDFGFAPYNSESFGFAGHLYVVYEDSSYFIKRAKYSIPRNINMNYVDRMYLQQDYKRDSVGRRIKVRDDIVAEFRLYPGTAGLYARRTIDYSNFSFDPPLNADVFDMKTREITLPSAEKHNDEFWAQHRTIPIKQQEDAVSEIVDRLKEKPFVKWTTRIIGILFSGYIHTNADADESRFDFGPVNSFISGNSVEGLRLKIAGTTTAKLHPQIFAKGYFGYGFGDEKFKYGGSLEYSFNKKKKNPMEYPIRSIKAFYDYDVNYLSQKYLHTSKDNFVLSLRRAPDFNATYQRSCGVTYKHEFDGGFSFELGLRNERQESTVYMPFNRYNADGSITSLNSFNQTMAEICLRYSPFEKYYTAYGERYSVTDDAPIFTLRHVFAHKGFLSDYNYNHTEIAASKRFHLSKFGYTDIIVKAGKVWDEVPYPLLIIPYANMSYTIQPESYSLLTPMEFLFDQYISWDLTYFANGLLFNHIPFLNALHFREVVSFRGMYGTINDANFHPETSGLFAFNDSWNVKRMTNMPYMEVSVGIDNILTILRIEYVFRVTYRDTPGANLGGVRIALHASF